MVFSNEVNMDAEKYPILTAAGIDDKALEAIKVVEKPVVEDKPLEISKEKVVAVLNDCAEVEKFGGYFNIANKHGLTKAQVKAIVAEYEAFKTEK